ncbi:MAG: gliding motility protein GldN [Bernardetiaceae bacterium]|nr:gliding motility protein GldN [Bernardetiaceae bacterium]
MNIIKSKILICLLLISMVAISANTQAQEFYNQDLAQSYNTQSVASKQVHNAYKFYQKTLWFQIDFTEKQNHALMARGNELPTIIIEAAKNGIIRPYQSDALKMRMDNETFSNNLLLPGEGSGLTPEEEAIFGNNQNDGWGNDGWVTDEWEDDEVTEISDEFFAKDFSLMRVKEDLFFDKTRGRMIHDIQSLEIILPAEKNIEGGGIDKTIAVFSYKEIVNNLFRGNPEATWYNAHNSAANNHRNLEEALELRLFAANIVKYDNPNEDFIIDMSGNDERNKILKAMQYEADLIAYESHLWEN